MSYILIHGLGQTQESWKPVISSMRLSEKILCPNLPTLLHKQECNYHNLYASFSQYCAKASEPLNLCGLSVGGILALHYAIDHPDEVASLVLIGTQFAMPKKLLTKASEPLNLCGLSVGGILALHYAIDHPDEVASLVLIGTQFAMPKKLLKFQNFIFRLMPKRAFLSMGFSKKDFIQLSKTMMDLDFRVQLSRISCPTLIVCGEKDIANRKASIELADLIDFIQLSKTMMDLDFRVQLSRISCPTLIVCGEKDIANRKASIELADLIPNADLQILHGCGHEVNQEMPEQLAEALDHFYASVSSGDIP